MKNIAKKSNLAVFLLCLGEVVSILFGVVALIGKMSGWEVLLTFAVIFFIAVTFGIIYELKRPANLIKADGKNLLIYIKGKWTKVAFEDVIKVDFHNAQSGRTVPKFGTLTVYTKSEIVKIYNVKNVAQAWKEINIIIYQNNRAE